MTYINPNSSRLKLAEVEVGEVYMILTASQRTYANQRTDKSGVYGRVIGIDTYKGYGAGSGDKDVPKDRLAQTISENATIFTFDLGDTSGNRRVVAFRYLNADGTESDKPRVCSAGNIVCTREAWEAQEADRIERVEAGRIQRESELARRRAEVEQKRSIILPWMKENGFVETRRVLPDQGEVNLNIERYADEGYVTLTLTDFARLVGTELPTGE